MCAIEGTVRGADGGIVPGANVELTSEGQTPVRSTRTDAQGRYELKNLPCETYVLSVAMAGFQPAALGASLPPEGGTAQVDLTLKLGTSDTVTVVATEKEIAAAQVKLQEQQRMAGVFPNFFVSYQWRAAALSPKQKFGLALRNATDPGSFLVAGFVAGIEQGTDGFPGYGQGGAGYGRRYGAAYGNLVIGTFLGGAILPTIFKQDPRYFYRGSGTVKQRALYAVSRAFVTRGDNGKTQVNWSGMLGDIGSGAISNAYYAPEDRQGGSVTIANGVLAIGGDCFNNLMQEFVLRKLTTKTKGRHGKATDTP